jgi:hypothetical protein
MGYFSEGLKKVAQYAQGICVRHPLCVAFVARYGFQASRTKRLAVDGSMLGSGNHKLGACKWLKSALSASV